MLLGGSWLGVCMEAFSLAVRRRIIELFQRGLEGDDVAEIMACSTAAARRIWQRYREQGLVGPRPHAGGHSDFARVIFLDESGALTNLVRTWGRSDCGTRC